MRESDRLAVFTCQEPATGSGLIVQQEFYW